MIGCVISLLHFTLNIEMLLQSMEDNIVNKKKNIVTPRKTFMDDVISQNQT